MHLPGLPAVGRWALVVWVAVLAGCTTVVTPPAAPVDPVVVYVLDHGRHPTLVVPTDDGGLIRYAYGDWSWYALARTGPLEAVRAVLLCNRAGLGRREFDTPDIHAVLALDPAEQVYPIAVARADAEALRGRLESIFESNRATLQPNPDYHLDFVHHPEPYSGLHNCNHVMAAWLRQLDCEVRGLAFLSEWKVKPPVDR